MKTPLSLAICFLTLALQADTPLLYEGFDMGGDSGSAVGSEGTFAGRSSAGWMSSWVIKKGASTYQTGDLAMPGLLSKPGLVSNTAASVVMRQLGESCAGIVFGSFRVQASQLKEDSIMALLFSVPQKGEYEVNVKTAMFGFIATRWASPLGAISVGGKVFKVPEGEPIQAGNDYLVLWKITNMPKAGERRDMEIRLWVLNREQVAYFAREGFSEKLLNSASSGRDTTQVLQTLSLTLQDSKVTLVKGLVVSCFSYQVPDARFDEIRISQKSLADAAGLPASQASKGTSSRSNQK